MQSQPTRGQTPLLRDRALAYGALAAIFVLICLRHGVGVRAFWDDAYIMLRYARNWVGGSPCAWNPGGPPVDGATSPLWLALCAAITAAAGTLQRETETLLKGLCLACAGAWLLGVYRAGRLAWPAGSRLWVCLPIVVIGVFDDAFAANIRSGMETLLAGALVALALHLLLRAEAKAHRAAPPSELWRAALAAGLAGFLCALTRPELAVFALLAPALLAWKHRRDCLARPLAGAACLVVACGLLWIAFKIWLYGAIIPLPACVKSPLRPLPYEDYNPATVTPLRGLPFDFMVHYAALVVALVLILAFRKTRRDLAWLWAPLALLLAYWAATPQIMGNALRFYQPLVPMLLVLLWAGASQVTPAAATPRPWRMLALALATLLVVGAAWNAWDLARWRAGDPASARFLLTPAATGPQRFLSQWPRGMTIAATEVGYLGYANPGATIIDLSGLNDPQFCRGFDADALFARRPDAICLVHPDYRGMTRRIVAHREFAHFQQVFPAGAATTGTATASDSAAPDLAARVYVDTRSPVFAALSREPGR